MATIFPREEKAEQLFEKILENPESQYTRQLMDSVIRLKRREDQKL